MTLKYDRYVANQWLCDRQNNAEEQKMLHEQPTMWAGVSTEDEDGGRSQQNKLYTKQQSNNRTAQQTLTASANSVETNNYTKMESSCGSSLSHQSQPDQDPISGGRHLEGTPSRGDPSLGGTPSTQSKTRTSRCVVNRSHADVGGEHTQ